MTTSRMGEFLEDTLGISSDELKTVPSTRLRSIIADRFNRSVEVLDHGTKVISISDIDGNNESHL